MSRLQLVHSDLKLFAAHMIVTISSAGEFTREAELLGDAKEAPSKDQTSFLYQVTMPVGVSVTR